VVKVRRLVCEWLASPLRVRRKPSPPPRRQHFQDVEGQLADVTLDDGFLDARPGKTTAVTDPLLTDIREMMRKEARGREEERARKEMEGKTRKEWMLAAEVVDRLCFVFFLATLVTVTVAFFLVFHTHQ